MDATPSLIGAEVRSPLFTYTEQFTYNSVYLYSGAMLQIHCKMSCDTTSVSNPSASLIYGYSNCKIIILVFVVFDNVFTATGV